MKKLLTVALSFAIVALFAGATFGAIGWAGQIWPTNGLTRPEGTDIDVYLQIWKDGVTPGEGQGADISATLYYGPNGGPYSSVAMAYLGEQGNNDEYRGYIPSAALEGESEIWFYCEAYDSTDASTYAGCQDQSNNDPPFQIFITPVLNQDVLVYFRICLPPEGHPEYDPDPGDVCVTGDAVPLSEWGVGVLMARPCSEYSPLYYEVGVLFPAGSNPAIQYKYRKNGCSVWESVGNRMATIDDSSSSYLIPWVDHWNNYEGDDCLLCGVATKSATWGEIKRIYQ
ncbi:MAG TPA: hypothetical protein VMX58_13030 [Patescibacteria group bacterium]|nr:hypothetical protein [Patescibacteria group bacterium]